MSKNFKIVCLKSILNAIAFVIFLIGNIYSETNLVFIGGAGMILFSFILHHKLLNPLIAIVLGVVLTIILTPWYLGIFWAVSIYIMFQIITLLHNIFTKPDYFKTKFY